MASSRTVHLVTDSASDLPMHVREELCITVVPLSINFGTESFLDSVDISSEQFITRLKSSKNLPSTAQPTVEQYERAFKAGLDKDMDVLCICLSSGLSGTINSARLAAEHLGSDRIRIVDSHVATMQLGWTAVETARAIEGGADIDTAERIAIETSKKVYCFAVLQTLDYVYKGGRIGRAAHMVGSALGIKPVVGFDHVLVPYERVRTWKKALVRAVELATSKGEALDIAVLHSDNLPDALKVEAMLKETFPHANYLVDWCGPTVTTYAGPGAIGIMIRVA